VGFALLFMLPGSGISLAFPRLTGDLVDTITKSGTSEQLTQLGGIFLGLLLVQAVIGYFVSTTLAKTTETVIAKLRGDLFGHIVRLPLSFLSQRRVGELSSRLSSDLTQVQETFTFSILQLIRQSVFLIGSLVIIITTSLPLTIPIVVGTPIIVGIAVLMGRRIRKLSTATQDALAATATIVEETLQSIPAVKSFVMETHETSRYQEALKENVRLAVKGARLRALFVTFIIFVIFGGIAGVILYGANLVAANQITMGKLLSFLMYAMFVGGAMGSFAELIGQVQKTAGASVRLKELLDEPTEGIAEYKVPGSEFQVPDAGPEKAAVELRCLSFSYTDRMDTPVLTDVSLSIAHGERVAFVGESGAGKSTTASLIQRLYEPTAGEILYDGVPSSELTLEHVRSRVGIVPQDIVLFGGSIEDNIRYGRPDATEAELNDAARSANALEFIERFPDGMKTLVGERGVKLSGGQRQRVAIARALLKNPPLLILDEATSSLDAESEHLIQEALERLMEHRTTIVIAHRLSTVRKCDRIYVFERGSIVESGAHEELLALNNGRYRRWCDLQFIS
jgi:ABC-type multidrug transport system fused ATPase/permease subunit